MYVSSLGVTEEEWAIARQIVSAIPQALRPYSHKIDKECYKGLNHSFLVINDIPYAIDNKILGTGFFSKVKLGETENGVLVTIKIEGVKDKNNEQDNRNARKTAEVARAHSQDLAARRTNRSLSLSHGVTFEEWQQLSRRDKDISIATHVGRFVGAFTRMLQSPKMWGKTIKPAKRISIKNYTVLKYLDGITLKKYLVENSVFKLPKSWCLQIAIGAVKELQWLHSLGIIHFDIKAENLLINTTEQRDFLKMEIFDFGLSEWINDPNKMNNFERPRIFPKASAPEILLESPIARARAMSMNSSWRETSKSLVELSRSHGLAQEEILSTLTNRMKDRSLSQSSSGLSVGEIREEESQDQSEYLNLSRPIITMSAKTDIYALGLVFKRDLYIDAEIIERMLMEDCMQRASLVEVLNALEAKLALCKQQDLSVRNSESEPETPVYIGLTPTSSERVSSNETTPPSSERCATPTSAAEAETEETDHLACALVSLRVNPSRGREKKKLQSSEEKKSKNSSKNNMTLFSSGRVASVSSAPSSPQVHRRK